MWWPQDSAKLYFWPFPLLCKLLPSLAPIRITKALPMNFQISEKAQLKTIILNMGIPGQNSGGL